LTRVVVYQVRDGSFKSFHSNVIISRGGRKTDQRNNKNKNRQPAFAATMRPFQVLSLLLLCSLALSKAITKKCWQSMELESRFEYCPTLHVPERICWADTCQGPEDGTTVCGVVAHALLTDFEIFDVVLLHDGLCQAEIPFGTLTRGKVEAALPSNQQLVSLNLNGSDLLAALEHGIDMFHFQNVPEASPVVAGFRFDVNLDNPYGDRVSHAEILDYECQWKPIQLERIYYVLTNEALADGAYDYAALTRANFRTQIKSGVTDAFWFYSESVCVLRDPYPRPVRQGLSVCEATPV
jgi:hypothetical protein